jgi:hypothetical protein
MKFQTMKKHSTAYSGGGINGSRGLSAANFDKSRGSGWYPKDKQLNSQSFILSHKKLIQERSSTLYRKDSSLLQELQE